MGVRLDHSGIAEILKSAPIGDAIGSMAEGIAARARDDEAVHRHNVPVKVDRYTTDRAAAAVTLAHPAGRGIEAKHGPLTRAAGDAGLEVRSRDA